ncbi:hypothetical protein IW261DRAFT_1531723 [Armillaria novae-zelandiae]|uniref:Uncharacterized protein n=1 Tax=Armillaria novae-zelandiae TaxID=153914 RepID=A0AA39N9F0_9AGAR|nr:hypothetical protein IW261DRAFT_1531723 [Armillaria novae-zelandiae]
MSYLNPSFQLPHLTSLVLVPYVEARLVISQERYWRICAKYDASMFDTSMKRTLFNARVHHIWLHLGISHRWQFPR